MAKRINSTHLITVISATILVGVELLVAGVAGGWALAGMFGLGEIGAYVLEAAGAALALYFVVQFWLAANRVEPVVERA
jgi:hypothetical protein